MGNNLSLLTGELTPIHYSPKDMDFDSADDTLHALSQIEHGHQYWIGDFLNWAKAKFPETWPQLIPTDKADTWNQYMWVSSRVDIGIRKYLSGYAQARIMARLSPERQKAMIKESNPADLTSRELADEVRKITRTKNDGQEQLPDTLFKIIYADPPWQYNDTRDGIASGHTAAEDHYPTMPLAAICDMPVKAIANKDAVLFLWVTAPLLFSHAPAVIEAWGFEYKAGYVWNKQLHMPGNYNSVRHEHLLICTRGSMVPEKGHKSENSVQSIKRSSRHSEKPVQFRDIIDKMYPNGERIELFARGDLPDHWQKFGNE